jgi:hypothetical protein
LDGLSNKQFVRNREREEISMTSDPGTALEELQLAHRSFGASRDPQEAVARLRAAIDGARHALKTLPAQVRGEPTRHVARQLIAYIELAEASLRGREPAA